MQSVDVERNHKFLLHMDCIAMIPGRFHIGVILQMIRLQQVLDYSE